MMEMAKKAKIDPAVHKLIRRQPQDQSKQIDSQRPFYLKTTGQLHHGLPVIVVVQLPPLPGQSTRLKGINVAKERNDQEHAEFMPLKNKEMIIELTQSVGESFERSNERALGRINDIVDGAIERFEAEMKALYQSGSTRITDDEVIANQISRSLNAEIEDAIDAQEKRRRTLEIAALNRMTGIGSKLIRTKPKIEARADPWENVGKPIKVDKAISEPVKISETEAARRLKDILEMNPSVPLGIPELIARPETTHKARKTTAILVQMAAAVAAVATYLFISVIIKLDHRLETQKPQSHNVAEVVQVERVRTPVHEQAIETRNPLENIVTRHQASVNPSILAARAIEQAETALAALSESGRQIQVIVPEIHAQEIVRVPLPAGVRTIIELERANTQSILERQIGRTPINPNEEEVRVSAPEFQIRRIAARYGIPVGQNESTIVTYHKVRELLGGVLGSLQSGRAEAGGVYGNGRERQSVESALTLLPVRSMSLIARVNRENGDERNATINRMEIDYHANDANFTDYLRLNPRQSSHKF